MFVKINYKQNYSGKFEKNLKTMIETEVLMK